MIKFIRRLRPNSLICFLKYPNKLNIIPLLQHSKYQTFITRHINENIKNIEWLTLNSTFIILKHLLFFWDKKQNYMFVKEKRGVTIFVIRIYNQSVRYELKSRINYNHCNHSSWICISWEPLIYQIEVILMHSEPLIYLIKAILCAL